jgi:WD40 repeat protein
MAMTGTPFPNPPAAARDLIFISYSRRDRDWLEHLRIFLKPYTRQNLKIWADPYIEVGGQWRRDISAALLRSCVGVLLLSPNFLDSDFIYSEELPPLLEGAATGSIILVVIPISASNYEATPLAKHQFAHPPDRPLDRMREARRNAALVEITKKIVTAAQKAAPELSAAPRRPAVRPLEVVPVAANAGFAGLHGVPAQRPNYLRRQEYLDRLKQAVLGSSDRAVGITGSTGGRVGLHGMGGIGKTVLAIDLVNDDEIRGAFRDGIFWLTLGQSIEPLQLQGELAGFITGEAKAFAMAGEARDQLRRLFGGKSCLLVLDDLWRPQDAEPFDVLGPRSRLVLTTRDADLLVALGARELPLDVLSEELALELLASWSGQAAATLPPKAVKVAESCGYLPLALALAGARVQGGASWDDVLSALERGRLEFLDHPYGSVFKSLRLGSDALSEIERDRYFELAVFPEDTEVSADAICTLWRHTGKLVPEASRDLLLRLQRRALLLRSEDGKRISFHDLQRDFLRLNVVSLVEAHTALVDAYRALATSGWASGPDDGYFFQHLPQHLAAADRRGELKALLCDYDWLSAKLRVTNVTAILDDYGFLRQDRDLSLVQKALQLSSPALLRDVSQLPSQLLGRLRGVESPAIQALVAGGEKGPGRAWLFPRFASLTPPSGPLQQILLGHTSPVTAVTFVGDGRRALSGSQDKTLRLWDLATGERLRTLDGHTARVGAVTVLADGSRALSGSLDKTLRLWDLATGETLRVLKGHTDWVITVVVSGDGSRALSGSRDGTLRLWDLATGETLRTLARHTRGVRAVAMLADGSRALSGSEDNTLRLWDLATGETLRILQGHTDWVIAVTVPADGRRAFSGSRDGTLRLWDLTTGETLRTLTGNADWVAAAALSADGSRALSSSYNNTLRLWDLATGNSLPSLEGHTHKVTALALSADGTRALTGSEDKTLRLWDLATGEALRILKGHTSEIKAVALLPNGSYALSVPRNGEPRLWDLVTGDPLRTFGWRWNWDRTEVSAMAVLADGSRALGGYDNTLRLWDLATGKTLHTLQGHRGSITSVAVLVDGSCAVSGSVDYTLRLWDLVTGETLRTLVGHTKRVNAVAVLADGSRAVSSSDDCTLQLWDLATGDRLRILEGHTGSVGAVALSADGSRALSGSFDRTLRLWDLATGNSLHRLEGHSDRVTMVALSADGRRALSSSFDHTLRLWDLATGESLAEYIADAAIDCAAFARDNLIVAGSADGKIHILEIRSPRR